MKPSSRGGKASSGGSWPGLLGATGLGLLLLLSGCLSWNGPRFPGGAPDRHSTVEVEDGDTYYSIAKRYNLSVDELITLNRARPPFLLRPGDKLLLPDPAIHVVRENETLITVARRYGVDHERLARRNGIENPGQVHAGMVLSIPESGEPTGLPVPRPAPRPDGSRTWRASKESRAAPSSAAAYRARAAQSRPARSTSRLVLDWPVRGRIVSDYGRKDEGAFNDGINIAVRTGTPIRAAAPGVVIYRGNLVPGFGRLVLIKHQDEIVTAYAHLSSYGVREGDRVTRGQVIGRSGSSGNVSSPQLHFEVRRGVRAVDPAPYMARRS